MEMQEAGKIFMTPPYSGLFLEKTIAS